MISPEKREIVEFFLNIFKLQMNLSGRVGQYRLISDADTIADQIFELRAQGKDQWISRRMTISPLGDESGSKSKCFKVIYDDMIVVKIPPVPITDFSKYFESIQAERLIAQAARSGDSLRDAQFVRYLEKNSAVFQRTRYQFQEVRRALLPKKLRSFPSSRNI